MAEENVTLPGLGPTKKTYVYIGAFVVAGLVAFAYYRRSQAPVPDQPTWGDVDPAEMTPDNDYDRPSSGNSNVSADLTGDTITTNAEWSQAVTTHLGNIGYDPKLVASALGRFFNREGLAPDQLDAVKAAVGQFGPPPVGGPWPITAAAAGDTGTVLGAVANLRATSSTATHITLTWDPVPGATRYAIELHGRTNVHPANFDYSTTNSYTVGPLPRPNFEYVITVRAQKDSYNGPGTQITARTA